jgi:hypothetical protein
MRVTITSLEKAPRTEGLDAERLHEHEVGAEDEARERDAEHKPAARLARRSQRGQDREIGDEPKEPDRDCEDLGVGGGLHGLAPARRTRDRNVRVVHVREVAREWRIAGPAEIETGPRNASADGAGFVTLDAGFLG